MKGMKLVNLEEITDRELCEMLELKYIPSLKNAIENFVELSDRNKTNKEVAEELELPVNTVKTLRSRLIVADLIERKVDYNRISDEELLEILERSMKFYTEFVVQSKLSNTYCLKRMRKLAGEEKVGFVNFQLGRANPAISKYKILGNANETYVYKMTHVQKVGMANVIVNFISSSLSSYLQTDVRKNPKNLIPLNIKKALTHYVRGIVNDKDVQDMVRDWYAKPWV